MLPFSEDAFHENCLKKIFPRGSVDVEIFFKMAACQGVRALSRKAFRVFDVKPNKNVSVVN